MNYILEVELKVNRSNAKAIDKYMNVARSIYNLALSIAIKNYKITLTDRKLIDLKKQKETILKAKQNKTDKQSRLKSLNESILKREHELGFSQYALQHILIEYVKNIHTIYKPMSLEIQKLSDRAFRAVKDAIKNEANGKRFKIKFKSKYDIDMSVSNKNNQSGLKFKDQKLYLCGNKVKPYDIIVNPKDKWLYDQILDPNLTVVYPTLVVKGIREKKRYYIQLTLEGVPPRKKKLKQGKDTMGIDIGTSTIATYRKDKT